MIIDFQYLLEGNSDQNSKTTNHNYKATGPTWFSKQRQVRWYRQL